MSAPSVHRVPRASALIRRLVTAVPDGFFVLAFAAAVAATIGMAFVVYWLDPVFTNNDLIRRYQSGKLELGPCPTVIVGDSSAGNAINAEVFSRLSGHPVRNLALTGSFGFEGSLNMLRQAVQRCGAREVILMHTLDLWRRPSSLQNFYQTGRGLPRLGLAHPFMEDDTFNNRLQFALNPRRMASFAKYLAGRSQTQVDRVRLSHDYLAQRKATVANGGLIVPPQEALRRPIHPDKAGLFELIDAYCGQARLNCLYTHGPLYVEVFDRSQEPIRDVARFLSHASRNITVIPDPVVLTAEEVGDSTDHVDVSAKAAVTRRYYDRVRGLLR